MKDVGSASIALRPLIHFFSPGLRQCMAGRVTNDELGAHRLHRVEVTPMWADRSVAAALAASAPDEGSACGRSSGAFVSCAVRCFPVGRPWNLANSVRGR
jgi:hypothetical protein